MEDTDAETALPDWALRPWTHLWGDGGACRISAPPFLILLGDSLLCHTLVISPDVTDGVCELRWRGTRLKAGLPLLHLAH